MSKERKPFESKKEYSENTTITVGVSRAERNIIHQRAGNRGLSKSEYIRSLISKDLETKR